MASGGEEIPGEHEHSGTVIPIADVEAPTTQKLLKKTKAPVLATATALQNTIAQPGNMRYMLIMWLLKMCSLLDTGRSYS